MAGSPPFGVYVHVPFCTKRCDYCAFATWSDRDHLIERYVAGVVREIRSAAEGKHGAPMPLATSVFVGGGTPSLLSGAQMASILDAIPRYGDAEITIECNPDSIDDDKLRSYVDHGVNRVSFGVQSMVDHVLRSLGRSHVRANVLAAVDAARRAGLPTFNLDLIYGAAGETTADWTSTLRDVVALDPPHVSAYALTIEAGTPLADDPDRFPDDDDQADKHEIAEDLLGQAGLSSYEISNWARPGHECRHNRLYWAQGDYLGFGSAAHSHRRNADGTSRRWWNVRTPERYLDLIDAGRAASDTGEDLAAEVVAIEGLQLALRTTDGVPVGALASDDAAEFLDAGLIERVGASFRLTRKGRMLANTVSIRLQAVQA